MINIRRVVLESRARDKKRKRFLLIVGKRDTKMAIHITQKEARGLRSQLNRFNLGDK